MASSIIGVYVESWAVPWTSLATTNELARIDKPTNTVFLSFVEPNTTYGKGQCTFANTGLNFSVSFDIVKTAIIMLKQKGIRVMLAVGGASYQWDRYNPNACAALMNDLGCDGIDLDWEPTNGYADRAQLSAIINNFRVALSLKYLSLAVFGYGCMDPNGDTYRGLNIDGLKEQGKSLDWVNIMAYDGGKELNVIQCYESVKKYFAKPVAVGFQVGKQGWGDALLTMADVEKICRYITVKNDGCFVWAYFKQGPPSAKEVCQKAGEIFSASVIPKPPAPTPLYPPRSLNQFQCPQCKCNLTVT